MVAVVVLDALAGVDSKMVPLLAQEDDCQLSMAPHNTPQQQRVALAWPQDRSQYRVCRRNGLLQEQY